MEVIQGFIAIAPWLHCNNYVHHADRSDSRRHAAC